MELTDANIIAIYKSEPLHDIGKVGIPDAILLKPEPLTAAEFEIIKTHTTLGRDAILHAEQRLGVSVPFLNFAKEITYSHQEKWYGSGYPQGLAGEETPISARLMALADVYDALISKCVYKAEMTHGEAANIIIRGRATDFDPAIVDAFIQLKNVFSEISAQYRDYDIEVS